MSGTSSSAPAATAATATTSTHPTRDLPLGKLYEIKCLKDNGSNFQIWSSQIKLVLENCELWEIVDGTETAPAQSDSTYK